MILVMSRELKKDDTDSDADADADADDAMIQWFMNPWPEITIQVVSIYLLLLHT